MICEALSDRMPAVARGEAAWDQEEAEHLAWCPECRAEWAVVAPLARAAATSVPVLDLDRIARGVEARLGSPTVLPIRQRARWRRPLGLLAAAAAAILGVAALRAVVSPDSSVAAVATRERTAIPELDALVEADLEILLATLQEESEPTGSVLEGGGIPRLGDLTDAELELLLEAVES